MCIILGIPERLVEIREKHGYTRRRLCDELGKSYATVSKYETGEREPGHEYIIEIAKKFGVTTDYILGLGEESAPTEEEARIENIINSQRGQALLGKYSMLTEPAQDRVDATVNDIWSNPANRIDQQFQAPEPITYTTAASGGEPGLRSGTISVSQEELDKQWREAQMAQDLEDWG